MDQRNVRPRFDEGGAVDEPMPAAFNPRNIPQAGPYREGDSSSASPPAVSPPRNAVPWKAPNPVIPPPVTDGEGAPTLTEVNPEHGSITGGARIWLKGIDFPALFPLFARFGTAVVPTVSLTDERCKHQLNQIPQTFSAANLLACHLPPASMPGSVNVTLSKHPQPNAPEYGTSIAKFQYLGDHDQL